jgi:hypothetical protein
VPIVHNLRASRCRRKQSIHLPVFTTVMKSVENLDFSTGSQIIWLRTTLMLAYVGNVNRTPERRVLRGFASAGRAGFGMD